MARSLPPQPRSFCSGVTLDGAVGDNTGLRRFHPGPTSFGDRGGSPGNGVVVPRYLSRLLLAVTCQEYWEGERDEGERGSSSSVSSKLQSSPAGLHPPGGDAESARLHVAIRSPIWGSCGAHAALDDGDHAAASSSPRRELSTICSSLSKQDNSCIPFSSEPLPSSDICSSSDSDDSASKLKLTFKA